MKTEKFGPHELTVIYHPFTSEALRKALDHLRFDCGDFIHVLRDPSVYTVLQVVVAYDRDGSPRGWSGIYKRPENNVWQYPDNDYAGYCESMATHIIGVYVDVVYRGLGIGGRLKQEAIKSCVARGIEFTWQDAETRDWIECDNTGQVKRRY